MPEPAETEEPRTFPSKQPAGHGIVRVRPGAISVPMACDPPFAVCLVTDQGQVPGLGNVCDDEIPHAAGTPPFEPAASPTPEDGRGAPRCHRGFNVTRCSPSEERSS